MGILAIILGSLLFLLLEYNKAKGNVDFTIKTFIDRNWVSVAIVFVFLLAVIIFKESLITMVKSVEPYLNPIVYFGIATLGSPFIKRLIDIFDSRVSTKFGINK